MSASSGHSEREGLGREERRSTHGQGGLPSAGDSRSSTGRTARQREIAENMDAARERFARTSQHPQEKRDHRTPVARQKGAKIHFRREAVKPILTDAAEGLPQHLDPNEG